MNIFGRSDDTERTDETQRIDQRIDQGTLTGSAGTGDVDVIRREERLRAGVERVPVERVRFTTRVVTETRTLTVEVRREELVVERLPLQGGDGLEDRARADDGGPVLELVLREEVPEVVTRVRPVEQVRVYRDVVAGEQVVEATLAAEQVEVLDSREDFLK